MYTRIVRVTDSSNVETLAYDLADSKLSVHFQSGSTYLYRKVPPEIFGKVASAASVGVALNTLIIPHYEGTRIGD